MTDATFVGYHSFHKPGTPYDPPYGSFEVHYEAAPDPGGPNADLCEGWYWWPCFPGCLPDGDPSGPFPTAEGAYLDAIGE